MRTFYAYLKLRWTSLLYGALCFLIILTVFFLCYLPMEPVLYALGICVCIGFLRGMISFVRFAKKHQLLCRLRGEVQDTVEHLPRTRNLLEQDYQVLLSDVLAAKNDLSSAASSRSKAMLDYYTMWVHQVKTPIAAMQLILQESDTPEYLELRSELFKIQQYVEMVLCYLRLEGGSDFHFRTCDLDRVLRSAIHTYAGQFIRKKLRLVYQGVNEQVLTDDKWLQFVIEQLLSNALKYTKKGSVTICMEGRGLLVIRDTGIGIAPEDLPRIFERGFTGLNGRSDQRSTGIGLYLCRRIMDQLGHVISIQSESGKGTAVFLDLRRKSLEFD